MKRENRKRAAYGIGLIVLTAAVVVAVTVFFPGGRDRVIGSLAVIPFESLSQNPDDEFYASGVTEALISELSGIKALRVISYRSSRLYRGTELTAGDIAGKLDVDALIRGSILLAGSRLRISVQLIEASGEKSVWHKTYDEDLDDILVLQEDLARDIAENIRVVMTPDEDEGLGAAVAVDRSIHEAYLKGRFHLNDWTEPSIRKAIGHFEDVIGRDPGNAAAYAGLAKAYDILSSFDWIESDTGWPKARETAIQALKLDNNLLEARLVIADVFFMYDWDWDSAEREFKRLIELNPGYAEAHSFYSGFLFSRGRHEEALRSLALAEEYDPHSLSLLRLEMLIYVFSEQYEKALAKAAEMLEADPANFEALYYQGWVLKELSRYDEAISMFQEAIELPGTGRTDSLRAVAGIARVHAVSGQGDRARRLLVGLEKSTKEEAITPYIIAKIYAMLGENDLAFKWLDAAWEARSPYFMMLKTDPELKSVRDDPRFGQLLERMDLD